MIKNLILIICLLTAMEEARAQQGFTTSGGEASGPGGSTSFSFGQVDYTSAGAGGSVSQGVQQPHETVSVLQVGEKNVSVSAYPNPASDFLVIQVKNTRGTTMVCELLDLHGKVLLTQKFTGEETSLFLQNLPAASYFLKVNEDAREIATFKIIKNK